MRVGQARRRDSNEPAIVAALRAVGAQVEQVSGPGAPDLVITFHSRSYAVEVKSLTGRRTPAQTVTRYPIVRTVDEALAILGVARDTHR
jgi:hypothetical protein